MNNSNIVNELYIKRDTLSTRVNIHEKYSINKYGWNNWVFDQYNIKENYKILEFGCGTGNIWKDKDKILPNNIEIILTDISPLMVEKTKEKLCSNKIFNIQIMDIQNTPFQDNCFDIIIANHMLYHVSDIEKAIYEVKRILKNDGIFYATTVGKNHLNQLEIIYRIYNEFAKFSYSSKLSFILENGIEILNKYFKEIEIKRYEDSLEVTNTKDLMDYICSYNNIPENIYQEINKIIQKEIEYDGKKNN